MKDSSKTNKILFVDETKIWLFVYNIINNAPNLLFFKSEDYNKITFKTKLLKILTVAGNFLGFNIKNLNVVINDPNITIKKTFKQKYNGNVSKGKIKELLSTINGPQLNNSYLNKIIFSDWELDIKHNVTYASYVTYWTDYDKTFFFLNAILNECHISINSIDNLYLIDNKNNSSHSNIIKIIKNKVIYQQYDNGLLNDIITKTFDENELFISIAKEYSTNVNLIKNTFLIIKNTNLNISRNINMNLSFNLRNNFISSINIEKLLLSYKKILFSIVKTQFSQINYSFDNNFIKFIDQIIDFDMLTLNSSVFLKLIDLSSNNVYDNSYNVNQYISKN